MAKAGFRLSIAGRGGTARILNSFVSDVPPQGSGVNTVTGTVPADGIRPDGTVAAIRVPFPPVRSRVSPFQRTALRETNDDPCADSVNDGPPATAKGGSSPSRTGTGAHSIT